MKDEVLIQKAKILRESQFFIREDDHPLSDKQLIFLVLSGQKLVAEVTSGHKVKTGDGWHMEPDDPSEVENFLKELGLVYHLHVDDIAVDATIAIEESTLNQFLQTDEDKQLGLLFGYPATAVEAYLDGERLPEERVDELLAEASIPWWLCNFVLSKDNYREELEVVKRWQATLVEYGLI